MTAKILKFQKPNGASPHHRDQDRSIAVKTNHQIFKDVFEDVIEDWQRSASKNRLNEYIRGKLPPMVAAGTNADYVNDLNMIATTEQKLNMMTSIFCPGCTANNPYGWMAAFHRRDEIFSTPADMVSEANARALNIVLFVLFSSHLKTIGQD
jgi:hypothetical protein